MAQMVKQTKKVKFIYNLCSSVSLQCTHVVKVENARYKSQIGTDVCS